MNSFSSIEAVLYTMMNREPQPKRVDVRIKHKAKGFQELFEKECDKLKEVSYGKSENKFKDDFKDDD